ncbi:MAG: O-antigen ligase family protein [Pirellulales bacterium]
MNRATSSLSTQEFSWRTWSQSNDTFWNVGVLQLASSLLLLTIVVANEANFRVATVDDYRIDHQVFVRLAICGCCGLVGLANLQVVWPMLGRVPGLFACGYAIWALITAPIAYSPIQSAAGALGLFCVLTFAASVVATKSEGQIIRPILFALTIYIIGSWIAFVVFPEFGRDPYDEAAMGGELRFGGLSHPNCTGRLCALALAMSLIAIRRRHISRFFGGGLALLAGITLLATGSRTAMLGAMCAVSLLGWRHLNDSLRIVAGLVGTIVVSLALFGSGLGVLQPNMNEVMARSSRSGDVEEVTSLSGRTELWRDSWARFMEKPLTGHGYACARFVLAGRDWETHHAHHQLLNVLLTTGVVGGFCIAAALLWMIGAAMFNPNDLADVVLVLVLVVGLADVSILQSLPDGFTTIFLIALLLRQGPAINQLAEEGP